MSSEKSKIQVRFFLFSCIAVFNLSLHLKATKAPKAASKKVPKANSKKGPKAGSKKVAKKSSKKSSQEVAVRMLIAFCPFSRGDIFRVLSFDHYFCMRRFVILLSCLSRLLMTELRVYFSLPLILLSTAGTRTSFLKDSAISAGSKKVAFVHSPSSHCPLLGLNLLSCH